MKEKSRSKIFMKNAGLIIGGSLLYALGMNLFLTPLHLFSGGGVGLAQLLTLFLKNLIDVGNFNLYGIVYLIINIPLCILAYFMISKQFAKRSMCFCLVYSFVFLYLNHISCRHHILGSGSLRQTSNLHLLIGIFEQFTYHCDY